MLFLGAVAAGAVICALAMRAQPPVQVVPSVKSPVRPLAHTAQATVSAPKADAMETTPTSQEPAPNVVADVLAVAPVEKPLEKIAFTLEPDEKETPLDLEAREALVLVGADAAAEQYWLAAINDPSLPEAERQDLIEDLNQEGISDPEHPTLEDLPLIQSRLALIEEVGNEAMDQVNADAFAEAYRDLQELAMLATQSPPR